MKKLLSALLPYPWYLSLICTWLIIAALHVLGVLYGYFYCIIRLFAPINFEAVFFAYGCFAIRWYQPAKFPSEEYFFCAMPLLTLILILGGDCFAQKIRTPKTPIKLLYNGVFLFASNVLVHMALWHTWNPWVIFTCYTLAP